MVAKSSFAGGSSMTYDESRITSHVRTYNWPPLQLNFWIFIMLLASCTVIGVFSTFIEIQNQLLLPVPWYVVSQYPGSQDHIANKNSRAGTSPTSSRSRHSAFCSSV